MQIHDITIPEEYSDECDTTCAHAGIGRFSGPEDQCRELTERHSKYCIEHGGEDMIETRLEIFNLDMSLDPESAEKCDCMKGVS